jgi:hypothetical protein
MRRFIFAIIFVLLFVVACGQSRENDIRELEIVRLYTAMNDEVRYTEKVFKAEDAQFFSDVVKAECPEANVGSEFVRVELQATSSSLVIYTDKTGTEVACTVMKPKDQQEITVKTAEEAPSKDVAVAVNDDTITIAEVQQAIAALPENTPRDVNAINLVVNQLINQRLLQQAAAEVEVSAEEITQTRTDILEQANVTESDLGALLESQGASMEDFDQSVKEQAQLDKLFKQRLLSDDLAVTEEQAQEYYMTNPNAFLQSEQAVMRHILIAAQGRTEEQGITRAQAAIAALNSSDFCEVVRSFSDDEQSKDNCGVYVVPRGVLDPNLELASFSTPVNQTSVVTAPDGIHLVQTLQVVQAQVVPYNQVAGSLQADLRSALLQQRLNLYIATLRADAEIVSYLG